ncbi:MAG: glucan phosphoethanolaminetransferase (alkaline phosphatase superfamily) [Pseudohongiellaceae bacterium]|jgi:glucan phosphoethanolaminetransferase (alkaline phosphatase superfamily)
MGVMIMKWFSLGNSDPSTNQQSQRRPLGLIFLTALPLLLLWKYYSVSAEELAVQLEWGFYDYAACFVQDLFIWSALYLICSKLLMRPSGWRFFVSLFAINLILILQIVDARIKLKFLEPLSIDLIRFSIEEADLLAGSFNLFAGVNFWKGALVSIAVLWLISALTQHSKWLSPQGYFAKPLAAIEQFTGWCAMILVSSTLVLSMLTTPKPYGLHQNFVFSSISQGIFSEQLPGYRNHQERHSPEPLRPSSKDDFEHKMAPGIDLAKDYNVVLYILESTPLKALQLAEKATDTSLYNELVEDGALSMPCYATFATSTKSMYTLQTGMYASPTQEVLETRIKKLTGLPRTLRDAGYYTEFISAQKLHYQGSRTQYENMGYHRVTGLPELAELAEQKGVEFSRSGFGDGDDRLMFLPGFEQLKQKQPFLATYYTSASHYPYDFPGNSPGTDFERHQRSLEFSQAAIREMIAGLDAQGLMENTLIVITSDHGEEFFNGNFRGRGTTLSEATHLVPLILYIRGKEINLPSLEYARHIDIVPSILDILGLAPEGLPLQGHSIFKKVAKRPVYMNSIGRLRSIGLIDNGVKTVHSLDTKLTRSGLMPFPGAEETLTLVDSGGHNPLVEKMKAFSIYNEAALRDRTGSNR